MDDYKNEMPEGLGFSMAMNENAMVNFAKMSEEQRNRVIDEGRNAKSKDEMNRLVDRIAKFILRNIIPKRDFEKERFTNILRLL